MGGGTYQDRRGSSRPPSRRGWNSRGRGKRVGRTSRDARDRSSGDSRRATSRRPPCDGPPPTRTRRRRRHLAAAAATTSRRLEHAREECQRSLQATSQRGIYAGVHSRLPPILRQRFSTWGSRHFVTFQRGRERLHAILHYNIFI